MLEDAEATEARQARVGCETGPAEVSAAGSARNEGAGPESAREPVRQEAQEEVQETAPARGRIILSSPDILDQEEVFATCGVLGRAFAPAVGRQAIEDGIVQACGKKLMGVLMYTRGRF